MHAIFNLVLELPPPVPFFTFVVHTHIIIRRSVAVRSLILIVSTDKSKRGGGDGEQAVLNGFERAVDDGVDGVDDFVDEGLFSHRLAASAGRGWGWSVEFARPRPADQRSERTYERGVAEMLCE